MGTLHKVFTMKVLVILAAVILAVSAIPQTKNELTCSICVDIMTDLDEFITSDTTEQEIVAFVKQLCAAIGQLIDGFEATCNFIVGSQIPALIDAFVHDNLDPTQVCTDIFAACP